MNRICNPDIICDKVMELFSNEENAQLCYHKWKPYKVLDGSENEKDLACYFEVIATTLIEYTENTDLNTYFLSDIFTVLKKLDNHGLITFDKIGHLLNDIHHEYTSMRLDDVSFMGCKYELGIQLAVERMVDKYSKE